MSKMKDSGVEWIGEIPEGWEIVKFKNLFSFGRGLPITKADLLESGLPVINYGQIHSKQNDGVNLTDNLIRFVSPLFLESDASSLLNNGDFVFADTSEDVEGIGNAILVKHDEPIFAGYHTVICRPKFSGISRYFAYLFTTGLWRDQLRQLASGIKVFSITQTILSKVLLLIPPKEIQQKIASYLDHQCAKIDAILATIQQSIEKLKEYRQAVITRAVTKGLDPDARMKDSGVEWIGEIPEGWEVKRIGTQIYNSHEKVTYTGGFYIGLENIESLTGKYLESEFIPESLVNTFKKGDILFGKLRPYLNKCMISPKDGSASSEIFVLNSHNKNNNFFRYLFISEFFINILSSMTYGTKMPRINWQQFKDIIVPIPSDPVQQKISSYLDHKTAQIDALISEKQKLHDKITAYKKSLIYEYVTGKREVPDGWRDASAPLPIRGSEIAERRRVSELDFKPQAYKS